MSWKALLLAFFLASLLHVGVARSHHKYWHQNTDPWAHTFEGKIDCSKLDKGIQREEFVRKKAIQENNFSEARRLKNRLDYMHRLWWELCRKA